MTARGQLDAHIRKGCEQQCLSQSEAEETLRLIKLVQEEERFAREEKQA